MFAAFIGLGGCSGTPNMAPEPSTPSGGMANGGMQNAAGETMETGGTNAAAGSQPTNGGASPGLPPGGVPSTGPASFPLKLSSNGRFLVDQKGQPFLINQYSSWALIQALTTADAKDYLDALAQRHFNAVLVSIISADVRMAGGPPSWQGNSPFKTQWDFSTPNETYFAHADEIIKMAAARGMLVALVPAYLGYPTDASQGWADELSSPSNSVAKSLAYGQFLGNRYKDYPNLIWVAGGDNTPAAGSELEARLKAIVDGIRQTDKHLWTAHWDAVSHNNGVFSTENPTFKSYIDIDGYYAFNYDATQARDLTAYGAGKLFYHLDQSYETEPGGTPENIRRKAYSAILMGGAGSSFCAAPNYTFKAWRTNLDTTGTRETQVWYALFQSRSWSDLVPDSNHQVVTGGYGDINSNEYVAAARTASRGTLIAYLPKGHSITVNLAGISGSSAHIWWFDPTTGKATDAGTAPTSGPKDLAAPSSGSWVLVVDDDSLRLPAPGGGMTVAGASPSTGLSVPFGIGAGATVAASLLAYGMTQLRRTRSTARAPEIVEH